MDEGVIAPEPRPVRTVLAEMEGIAVECGGPSERNIGTIVERALSLMLEIRVPRMPDTDEELSEMLRESMVDAGGVPSDVAFDRLREHGRRFEAFLTTFRAAVADGRHEEAARMLLPMHPGGVTWGGDEDAIAFGLRSEQALLRVRDQEVVANGATPAHAIVAVVMNAHGRWPEIWKR